jgi:hypothetical protein
MKNEGLLWLERRRRVDEDKSVKYDVKEGREDRRPSRPLAQEDLSHLKP